MTYTSTCNLKNNSSAKCSSIGSSLLFLGLILLQIQGILSLGGMSSIAASYGEDEDDPMFCAIEATSKQQVFCWGKNSSLEAESSPSGTGPSLLGLSGGRGFMCGIKISTQQPFCWARNVTSSNLVPRRFQNTSYDAIAAGDTGACAARTVDGTVDCWDNGDNNISAPAPAPVMSPAPAPAPRGIPARIQSLVSGSRFTCGVDAGGTARCWGDPPPLPRGVQFEYLSAGALHLCGIVKPTRRILCWGDNRFGQTSDAPKTGRFVFVSSGNFHGCAVREDTHAAICWGRGFNTSATPATTQFLALASSQAVTCGVREDNLLVVCWGNGTEFTPPLQLASPGLCTDSPCGTVQFSFNASSLGVVTAGLCASGMQRVCSPCASQCLNGSFLSSPCNANEDRQCTECTLCQNSTCRPMCKLPPAGRSHRAVNMAVVLGAAVSGGLVVAVIVIAFTCCWKDSGPYYCIGAGINSTGNNNNRSESVQALQQNGSSNMGGNLPPLIVPPNSSAEALRFRLSELRDATNGFKEVNELGRGSYGFVYKAVLGDGRLVVVKRANAARRIHGSSRDFDAELEVLSKLRHGNIVNLVGYCGEMGERLLVYEFMPHGTLYDHLHGGLSPLGWVLRLRIAAQAAKGLEYLHSNGLVHRDVKSTNILLDSEWTARVADFGLLAPGGSGEAGYADPEYSATQRLTDKSDVYSFGVVLLEVLSGRKAREAEFEPRCVVEWAVPLIRQGRTVADVMDRTIDPPRNLDPVLRLADVAEKCVRGRSDERPAMTQVATWLEQIAPGSGTL